MKKLDFDNFIRKYTQKNLEVPDGLDWENMNIPLPEPDKKRRKFLSFWWLFLLVFIGVGTTYWWIKTGNSNLADSELHLQGQSIEDLKVVTTANLPNPLDTIEKNTLSNTENIIEERFPSISPSIQNTTANNAVVSNDNTILPQSSAKSKFEISTESLKLEYLARPQIMTPSVGTEKTINDSEKVSPIKQKESNLQYGNEFADNKREHKLPIQEIDKLKIDLLENNPEKILLELQKDYLPENAFSNLRPSLFVNFGVNQSYNTYSQSVQSEALQEAEEVAEGSSFQIGIMFPIKQRFFLFSGLTYQKLHTIFTYSENLGTELDLAQGRRVTKIKHICYNNDAEFLDFNVGIGKDINFGQKWGSQFTMFFSPSYQLRHTGRTLNQDFSVFEMNNYAIPNRLSWNASASTGLFLKVKNHRLVGSINWQMGLSKMKLLENSDLRVQQDVLSFRLGIERQF